MVGVFVWHSMIWFVGAPKVAQTTGWLPLSLVLRPCMPVKNATYKITIDTNKSPVNLGDLFSGQFSQLAANISRNTFGEFIYLFFVNSVMGV